MCDIISLHLRSTPMQGLGDGGGRAKQGKETKQVAIRSLLVDDSSGLWPQHLHKMISDPAGLDHTTQALLGLPNFHPTLRFQAFYPGCAPSPLKPEPKHETYSSMGQGRMQGTRQLINVFKIRTRWRSRAAHISASEAPSPAMRRGISASSSAAC